jgi:hypothetical protein
VKDSRNPSVSREPTGNSDRAGEPVRIIARPIIRDIQLLYPDALMRSANRRMARAIDHDLYMGAYRRALFEGRDACAAFAAGRAAMKIDLADNGVLVGAPGGAMGAERDGVADAPPSGDPRGSAAETSAIAGNVGFLVLPDSSEVWDPASGDWETLPAVCSVMKGLTR